MLFRSVGRAAALSREAYEVTDIPPGQNAPDFRLGNRQVHLRHLARTQPTSLTFTIRPPSAAETFAAIVTASVFRPSE